MTNEELRQRLIKIVRESLYRNIDKSCLLAENIANDLIANGVTIREHGEWQKVYLNKQAIVYECSRCHRLSFGTSDYCICGADMRGEETHGGVIHDKTVELRQNIKFETGDYAKIAGNVSEHGFEIGTIVRLEKCETDYKAFAGEEFWWVEDDELEPIEDANRPKGVM